MTLSKLSRKILRDDSQLWDYPLSVQCPRLAGALASLYKEAFDAYQTAYASLAPNEKSDYPDYFFFSAYSRTAYVPPRASRSLTKSARFIRRFFPLQRLEVCSSLPLELLVSPEESEPVFLVKTASSIVRGLADVYQLRENAFNRHLGGPTPLLSMLVGGLLTAGLGYGAGKLVENLFPESFEEEGLSSRLAVLGGLLGLFPGAIAAYTNYQTPDPKTLEQRSLWKSLVSPFVLTTPTEPSPIPGAYVDQKWRPPRSSRSRSKIASSQSNRQSPVSLSDQIQSKTDYLAAAWDALRRYLERSPLAERSAPFFHFSKQADVVQDVIPSIPVDRFNRVVWEDPLTPVPIRAATVGLTEGASQLQGGSPLVSPLDIARLAVGMGSGSLSGLLTGRVIGALAGLTPQAQDQLQQAGIWSGLLRTVIPQAYGF